MNTKLTLRMDDSVIDAIKVFAQSHHTSVSMLAETYFKLITLDTSSAKKQVKGVVGELAGLLKNTNTSSYRSEYVDYLEEKYK